jgi:cytochrome c oxidase cbb3-type subunit 3
MSTPRPDPRQTVGTTGHEWDGIEEYNHPLPRWWLWILIACIVWGIIYTILYPAWPGINATTGGVNGWSSRQQVRATMNELAAARAVLDKEIAALPVAALPADPKLMRVAVEGGRSAFKIHCVQCHGSGAAGGGGYPNLNDDDWLWGGDMQSLYTTLRHGIRAPGYDETRLSEMPAFGRDGLLDRQQISDVAWYVVALSGGKAPAGAVQRGAPIFAEQCASCHGPAGKGDRNVGAPNLTDAIWLYGGDHGSIVTTVANARNAVMPGWSQRLDDVTIRKLAAYVHSLGGGE